jgi:hypothetical protein
MKQGEDEKKLIGEKMHDRGARKRSKLGSKVKKKRLLLDSSGLKQFNIL